MTWATCSEEARDRRMGEPEWRALLENSKSRESVKFALRVAIDSAADPAVRGNLRSALDQIQSQERNGKLKD